MEIIATDTDRNIASMLEGYDYPAILVAADYQILASNDLYIKSFGKVKQDKPAYCYDVSHGYQKPCDQEGEDCPLLAVKQSGRKERVLHIHQTPRGKEQVDVEMLPIFDENGSLKFFVELLKPVWTSNNQANQHSLIGASPAFNKMLSLIARVGSTMASVLLLGQSGTGKELVALELHKKSRRSDKPMVTLECSGLTETLFESELFGHLKGAFTGANFTKQGLVEAADGGTLFLDEVGDIPYVLQVKLLRLLETGTYRPVGGTQTKRSDFRLICATHKDLWAMVEEGSFRQDLYYRINVFPIYIPSLAERIDDIALIANQLLKQIETATQFHLTESAMTLLRKQHYPGNIRELKNILIRATVLANTNIIDQKVIEECLGKGELRLASKKEFIDLKTLEKNYLRSLVDIYGVDKDKIAKIAGISVRSLYRKLQNAFSDIDQ